MATVPNSPFRSKDLLFLKIPGLKLDLVSQQDWMFISLYATVVFIRSSQKSFRFFKTKVWTQAG